MQVNEAVENGRGREGKRRVIVVDGLCAIVPVFHHLVEVLDFVLAQGSVALNGQPGGGVDGSLQLEAHTVRVLDVGGQVLADVAHLSCLDELVGIVHIEEVRTQAEAVAVVGIAHLGVEQRLGLGSGVGAVVGEVVALRLTMAQGHGAIGAMAVLLPRDTCLGVQEVVSFIDVEPVLLGHAVVVCVVLVVVAVRLIAYIAVLEVCEGIPLLADVITGLEEHVGILLEGVGIVVSVLTLVHLAEIGCHRGMGRIGQVAVVAALVLLYGESADDVPGVVLVVHVGQVAVGVLGQPLLAHEVGLLDIVALGICHEQSELREFVAGTELGVVAVAVGVVQRGGRRPVGVDIPGGSENVVVLPEVVRRLVPEGAVAHLVAGCLIVAAGILGKVAVSIIYQCLVE